MLSVIACQTFMFLIFQATPACLQSIQCSSHQGRSPLEELNVATELPRRGSLPSQTWRADATEVHLPRSSGGPTSSSVSLLGKRRSVRETASGKSNSVCSFENLNVGNKKCLKLQICKSFDLSALHALLAFSMPALSSPRAFW